MFLFLYFLIFYSDIIHLISGGKGGVASLREQFRSFSKFGDTKSDGKLLTLSQSDKWMKQAGVIDGKSVTTTDTAIHFKKFK